MSGFTALNVEAEDILEEEIDDTKEIQIEEAFKLYQNALKLHSQGPKFYDAADEAYKELFQSEVFKYPEAVTDYGHEQLDEAISIPTPANYQQPLAILPTNAADSAANSLPQLIYLSYKNRGQFILDVAHHGLGDASLDRKSACLYYYQYCLQGLGNSANALERDDTDLDLWKKAARISDVLSSQRLARFCLESVVAADDETGEQSVDLSGLDEAFASGELLQVLRLIQDDVAITKSVETQAQTKLLSILKTSNDPYSFLPQRATQLDYLHQQQRPNDFESGSLILDLADRTQASLADAFARSFSSSANVVSQATPGAFVKISLPLSNGLNASDPTLEGICNEVDGVDIEAASDSHAVKDKSPSPNVSFHSPASYHSAQDMVRSEPEVDTTTQKTLEITDPVTKDSNLDVDTAISSEQPPPELRLPTRKRSSTVAGIEEPEARTKSKRLRARESLLEVAAQEEEIAQENDYYAREQLALIEDSDNACLAHMKRLLSNMDIQWYKPIDTLQMRESAGNTKRDEDKNLPLDDMKQAINDWTEETNSAIMSGHGSRDTVEKAGGMSIFQRHLKGKPIQEPVQVKSDNDEETITAFVRSINQSQLTLADAVISWLLQLLTSNNDPGTPNSSYLTRVWTPEMKADTIQALTQIDEFLLEQITLYIRPSEHLAFVDGGSFFTVQDIPICKVTELVQTIFELHLDEYYVMTSPESQSSEALNRQQEYRLRRWAIIATELMQDYLNSFIPKDDDPLILRFLLSSALLVGLLAESDKAHVLACLSDVRKVLERVDRSVIHLPNNKAMPQVSIATIDQETSRLSTLDFFNSIFDNDDSDPVATIMKLEPILEPANSTSQTRGSEGPYSTDQQLPFTELMSFLDSGDASLRLFLWRRLQNAYAAISYSPKVVSCLLRSFEIIMHEIQTERHKLLPPSERQFAMLRWIRDADEIMTKVLSKVSDEPKPFECLDGDHLHSSLNALSTLLELLHYFVKYDDSVRVGQTAPPALRTSTAMKAFDKSRDKMRDAFVRGWTLAYHLIKEMAVQFPELIEKSADQLAEYLRLVHNILGPRQYCRQCHKIFIKLAKSELLSTSSEIDYSEDVAQILFDMYQIRFGAGFGDANHGCTGESLGRDKDTAFNLVPIIMRYARRLKMRELIKSELKGTIDKIQQTLGQVKPSPALSYNRKAVSTFLKSPINPQDVYRSLRGVGDLVTKVVSGEYAQVAGQSWYQMLGMMNLAKYRSIKRVNPTPTDDLDTAATFLRLDMEHNINNWETWYRLAQVFDSKIEDSLTWNSLKINDSRGEIAVLERSAINAYTMAIAMAMRGADDDFDAVQKISDMFSDFAFRLYASSRPPLTMEAFNTDKHMRHLSSSHDQSMSKKPFIFPFEPYTVWKFAAYLLQRKFATGQKEWLCYYTLGKCLWKMFQCDDNVKARRPVTIEDVLDSFTDAIDLVPTKEKSSEYILEPHYKLVSVVHKMVRRRLLTPSKGVEYLQATQFARSAHLSQDDQDSDWDAYILEILRKLGHADKSNWHHRITARAAHINFDDDNSIKGALGAKHQFTQQIFTKTMTMQVWKPEYERPGRHYVYTGCYLSFFVHLLDRLNDRTALEQLVRRIRRKTTDFLDHPKVWEETALTYVRLLRRVGKVPDGHERNLFDKISFDEFSKTSERVEKWAHDPENTSPYQDVVQDAIELKKLNNSLMKGPAIDDLIGDAYACMYEAFVARLPPEETTSQPTIALPQSTFINMTTDIIPTGDDNLDRMRLNNLLSVQTDGTTNVASSTGPSIGLGIDTPPVGTPPAEPIRIPTPSKPGRIKTITRREVQRKAEACMIKLPPVKTTILTKRPFIDLPGRRDSAMSGPQDETENDKSHADEGFPGSSRVSSRQPSVSSKGSPEPDDNDRDIDGNAVDDHDGEADDESELSELENDEDEMISKEDKPLEDDISGVMDGKHKTSVEGMEDEEELSGNGEGEQGNDANTESDGDLEEIEAEQAKDSMNLDEPEDDILEIQDSQEHTEATAEVPTPVETAPRTRTRQNNRKI